MKNLISFFLIIVFIAIIGASVYFVYRTSDDKTGIEQTTNAEENLPSAFNVAYQGENIDIKKNYLLNRNDSHRFNIQFSNNEKKEYSIKIIPNVRVGFTVNGAATILDEASDLTKCFNIDKHDDYFIVSLPENENLKTILEKFYPDENVKVSVTYKNSSMAFYRIIISVEGVDGYYYINFGISEGVSEVSILPNITF